MVRAAHRNKLETVAPQAANDAIAVPQHPSHIQICHAQRVLLDEFAARLDLVAHQPREHVVGVVGIIDPHLQQRADFGSSVVSQSWSAFISPRPL